jgi:hypothetical protein
MEKITQRVDSSGCLVALLFLFVCFAQCNCTVQWDFFQSFLSKNSCQHIFCSALQIVCFSMLILHPEANHSISKVNLLPYVLNSRLKLQWALWVQEHGHGHIWQLHSACWASLLIVTDLRGKNYRQLKI